MTVKSATILLASMVALLGGVRETRADDGIVVIGGTATEHDRTTVGAAVEAAARQAGWSLAKKPLTKKESEGLLTCSDSKSPWTCVPASLAAGGIHRVFVVAVENRQADNGAPMVVITGKVIVTDAPAAAVKQHFCEQCADDKLGATSTDLAEQLLRDLAVRGGHTMVSIRSTPTGAQVVLDSVAVGVTDASFNTFPGKHVVVVEKPGFLREIHELVVEDGKTAELAVTLRASEINDGHPGPQASHVVPGMVIGAGAIAIATGVVVYALDQDPSPTGGKQYWDTAPAGVVIGVAGVAAVGVGAYLWIRASRQTSSISVPSAAVVPGGMLFGWRGSF